MDKKEFFEKLSRYINLYEFIFDLTLVAITLVIYRLIVPAGGFIFIGIAPLPGLILFLGAQFFTALFFSSIYRSFMELREYSKFLEFLIKLVMFLAITGLYILMPLEVFRAVDHLKEVNHEFGFVILSLSGVLITLAVYLGTSAEDFPSLKYVLYVPFLVGAVTFPIGAIYFFMYDTILSGILFVVITAGTFTIAVILKKKISARKNPFPIPVIRAGSIFMIAALPILTAISIAAWQEMSLISTVTSFVNTNTPMCIEDIMLILTLGGLIPVRILALAPPYRIINTAIALPAMYFYFTSLIAASEKLYLLLKK